ncbi:DUF6257 family protein [Streptomyces prasinus]|uniref:Uncharacterized protein n=1 Tax=Streptomyces prasinus TaxID=67345 RepID=A0ABX6AZ50_9ACTN|nr:DUF6257 family protein [Streptomyces prasinus]QEV07799.1 hypothetical protein CP972_21105 [Streptomyces prasinus]
MPSNDPTFTTGEKAKLAWYIARMAKRGIADDKTVGRVHQADLQRKVDRVIEQARQREERDAKNNRRR